MIYYLLMKLEIMDIGKNKDESMLTWEDRFKVAVGIGEALNYLHKHNQTSKPIIHRDVKSSNILLSEGFEPHVIITLILLTRIVN